MQEVQFGRKHLHSNSGEQATESGSLNSAGREKLSANIASWGKFRSWVILWQTWSWRFFWHCCNLVAGGKMRRVTSNEEKNKQRSAWSQRVWRWKKLIGASQVSPVSPWFRIRILLIMAFGSPLNLVGCKVTLEKLRLYWNEDTFRLFSGNCLEVKWINWASYKIFFPLGKFFSNVKGSLQRVTEEMQGAFLKLHTWRPTKYSNWHIWIAEMSLYEVCGTTLVKV